MTMENILIVAGILLIFIGIILFIIGTLAESKGNIKFAIGGFIGPIPFGFANDENMLKIIILVSVFIFVLFILFILR
jgi:uncharacterized membrane protein